MSEPSTHHPLTAANDEACFLMRGSTLTRLRSVGVMATPGRQSFVFSTTKYNSRMNKSMQSSRVRGAIVVCVCVFFLSSLNSVAPVETRLPHPGRVGAQVSTSAFGFRVKDKKRGRTCAHAVVFEPRKVCVRCRCSGSCHLGLVQGPPSSFHTTKEADDMSLA